MRVINHSTRSLILMFLVLGSAAALAGDGPTITIDNNTTKNLIVTVYDLNTDPVQRIVSGATINSFASISVAVTPDDTGRAHVSWTAMTAGEGMRMCGRNDKTNLKDGDKVHVHANRDCGN